ncbi:unnamed protein product, partial [Meganyctiphanes norvegica]
QTEESIIEFTQRKDLRNVDSTVVIIMSHGNENYFFTQDGGNISFDYIINRFNNHNCPELKGKPKFFIFDCCRGDQSMQAFNISKVQLPPSTETNTYGTSSEDIPPDPIEVTTTDACIIYATVPATHHGVNILSSAASCPSFPHLAIKMPPATKVHLNIQ